MPEINANISIPKAFGGLFEPWRYKVYWGGRGAAKSWNIAIALLILGIQSSLRILCARELQVSITDSVHKLLADLIVAFELHEFYEVQKTTIIGRNGTTFLFKGLKHNATEIKSTEGVDVCWVEEAEKVSDNSWELLIPTIRKENSEIWVSFNAKNPTDATYQRFIVNKRPDSLVKKVSWRDNPFFPKVLDAERLHSFNTDPEAYKHIWEGEFDTRYNGAIYAKWVADCQIEGRVLPRLYDASMPVYTAWDLGYTDSTAIWFYQITHGEIRLIEYYENYGQDVTFYGSLIMGTNPDESLKHKYTYAGHAVPHDAVNKLLAAGGRSIYEQLVGCGLKNMRIVPATSQKNQIDAARLTLKQCWFDEDFTKDGVQALMQYHYEYDEDRKDFKKIPEHDWSSHAADAFEIIGQVWKEPVVPASQAKVRWANEMTFNELMALARKRED